MTTGHDAYEVVISEPMFSEGTQAFLNPLTLNSLPYQKTPTLGNYIDSWPGSSDLETSIRALQIDGLSSKWQNMSTKECSKRYGSDLYDTFSSVIIFTNWVNPNQTNNSALAIGGLSGSSFGNQVLLDLCPLDYIKNNQSFYHIPEMYILTNSSNLESLCEPYSLPLTIVPNPQGPGLPNGTMGESDSGLEVLYCLSQNESSQCSIVTDLLFWRIITAVLALQVLAMIATLFLSSNTPLLVVGDAICSFLKRPENTNSLATLKHPSRDYSLIIFVFLCVPVYGWIIAGLVIGIIGSLPGLSMPDSRLDIP